ncbi:MAG: hypothetical protein KQ78_01849 [Candidatus Izimaplasma bacterium HR2]|nr:MAG: hypothetical protein KQ78_01849 [Candidatus Izimaplasma bacterium HR2]
MARLAKSTTYGVLEMNRVASVDTKQVFSQLPLDATDFASIACENGMVLVYDEVAGAIRLPTDAAGVIVEEMYLVGTHEFYYVDKELGEFAVTIETTAVKHSTIGFAGAARAQYTYPDLYRLTLGDTFTTNTLDMAAAAFGDISVGHYFTARDTGLLTYDGATAAAGSSLICQVIKIYTVPNGDEAVKLKVTQVVV